jgi:hypothetical protein
LLASRRLNELASHKRLLILHAELHRTVLRAEYAGARARLSRLADGADHARVGHWLAFGVKIIGMLVRARRGRLTTWVSIAVLLWRWTRKAKLG